MAGTKYFVNWDDEDWVSGYGYADIKVGAKSGSKDGETLVAIADHTGTLNEFSIIPKSDGDIIIEVTGYEETSKGIYILYYGLLD
jgi:hypothetical protein